MIYYKIINDRMVFSDCKTVHKQDGTWVSNPDAQTIANEGWQVYVPPVVPPQPQTEPDMEQTIEAVKKILSSSTDELSDEDALDVAALFPTWASKIDQQVSIGERLWYNGKLYKVLQVHTIQSDWTPDVTSALYVEISIEEFPELVEPIPATNPYMIGDKVTYRGQHYVCKIDNCVWTPEDLPSAWELL